MSQPLERLILERALKILDAGWTCHAQARDREGRVASPLSPKAVTFCAQGALLRAAHELGVKRYKDFISTKFFFELPELNDRFGRTAVRDRMQRRLELL